MQLRYIGPHDGVDLTLPEGRLVTIMKRGGALETTDEFGRSLLEQPSNWREVEPKASAGAVKAAEAGKED